MGTKVETALGIAIEKLMNDKEYDTVKEIARALQGKKEIINDTDNDKE